MLKDMDIFWANNLKLKVRNFIKIVLSSGRLCICLDGCIGMQRCMCPLCKGMRASGVCVLSVFNRRGRQTEGRQLRIPPCSLLILHNQHKHAHSELRYGSKVRGVYGLHRLVATHSVTLL